MSNLSLTAVVLTHNSQDHLIDCLDSLTWCPNVLVLDDNSTDYTLEIVRQRDLQLIKHDLNHDFASHRNFALQQVKTDWTLFIDDDERVTPKLAKEITTSLQHTDNNAFRIHRHDMFLGKLLKYGDVGQWNDIRLARTRSGKWHGRVHEVWQTSGPTGQLRNAFLHFPHPTIAEFIDQINIYTSIRAKELHAKGQGSNWLHILAYPVAKFIQTYMYKQGYKDGVHGLVYAIFMSFHSFLVRSKLHILQQQSNNTPRRRNPASRS